MCCLIVKSLNNISFEYKFKVTKFCPHYSRGNGLMEKIVKKVIKKYLL